MTSRPAAAALTVLDRVIGRLCVLASWLSIPIVFALALQWPLREWIGRFSREVNDAGQCLFALYVAVAVTAASRAGAHLAAHSPFTDGTVSSTWPRRALMLFGVAPWCAWVLWHGAPLTLRSLLSLERFPDTFNAGYFVVKLAMWLLALLMLLHALAVAAGDVRRPQAAADEGAGTQPT